MSTNPALTLYRKKKDDKVFRQIMIGEMAVLEKVEVVEVKHPAHRWHGKKIPLSLWRKVLAFLIWSYNDSKSETLVNLYYHPTHGWEALVLPQRGGTGMSVGLIRDHEGVAVAERTLSGVWDGVSPFDPAIHNIPWERRGTVHHHCSSSAFASGGDDHDELTKDGLHITMGNMDKEELSIDGRVTVKGIKTEVAWEDWFEMDAEAARILPPKLHDQFMELELKRAPADRAFPDWWKDNVIKQVVVATGGSSSGGWGGSDYDHRRLPAHYQGNGTYMGQGGGQGQMGFQHGSSHGPATHTRHQSHNGKVYHNGKNKFGQSWSNWDWENFQALIKRIAAEKPGWTLIALQNKLEDMSNLEVTGLLVEGMIRADFGFEEAMAAIDELIDLEDEWLEKEAEALAMKDAASGQPVVLTTPTADAGFGTATQPGIPDDAELYTPVTLIGEDDGEVVVTSLSDLTPEQEAELDHALQREFMLEEGGNFGDDV